jgi:hypothetical protein
LHVPITYTYAARKSYKNIRNVDGRDNENDARLRVPVLEIAKQVRDASKSLDSTNHYRGDFYALRFNDTVVDCSDIASVDPTEAIYDMTAAAP